MFLWLTGKGDRSGTNIAQAYKNILESMQIEQITNKEDFLETQHIVIMFSDGIDDNIYISTTETVKVSFVLNVKK